MEKQRLPTLGEQQVFFCILLKFNTLPKNMDLSNIHQSLIVTNKYGTMFLKESFKFKKNREK
jgi:hypothetical protein